MIHTVALPTALREDLSTPRGSVVPTNDVVFTLSAPRKGKVWRTYNPAVRVNAGDRIWYLYSNIDPSQVLEFVVPEGHAIVNGELVPDSEPHAASA